MNDDAFYEQVADELEADTLKKGLWTRATAEADGDEKRAKAIYIKMRVSQLATEEAEREDKKRRDEAERRDKKKMHEKQEIKKAKLRKRYGFQ